MPRAVLFDLDGVLTNGWHMRPEKRVPWTATIEEDLGVRPKDLQEIFFGGLFETEVLTGLKTLEETLAEVLPRCGYQGNVSVFIAYWMEHDSHMKWPLLDIVKKLKATGKVRLFVATNNEKTRAHHMWENVGLKNYFEDIYYAGDFGVLKPDPAFFKECEKRIGDLGKLPPLFFDDCLTYIDGARVCGWEGVVFNDLIDCQAHPFIAEILSVKKPALT